MKKLSGLSISTGILVCSFLFFLGWGKDFPGKIANAQIKPNPQRVNPNFGKMPLCFIPNEGQMDRSVAFAVHGKDKKIYFGPQGLTIVLADASSLKMAPDLEFGSKLAEKRDIAGLRSWTLKLDFLDANPDIQPKGEEKTGAVISYFKGKPEDWKTGLAAYSQIIYPNLWPGIDLICSGTFDKLKYEFAIHPGADPSKIRLAYRGATEVAVNDKGQLEVNTPMGGFHDDTPLAYQDIGGKRLSVPVTYLPDQKKARPDEPYIYGFEVGEYDRTQTLIVDPAILIYCGYIGGNLLDQGLGIAVDSEGCAYITGWTTSDESSFPVTAGWDPTYNGQPSGMTPGDAFVAKVSADGTGLVYCSYIGGSERDTGHSIAVDSQGCAYIAGATSSDPLTFPVTVGPSLDYSGPADSFPGDVFVAKVNADGTGLDYCGYIGGSSLDTCWGIAVDSLGYAYIACRTDSSDLPVKVGPSLIDSGSTDAFVAKVETDGSGLVYCGYIGGDGSETAWGIAVDSEGCAYITGMTNSPEATFPVAIGPDVTYNGGAHDAFVVKVNSAGSGLSYCGYIGGDGEDVGRGIAVDGSGNAYVTGYSSSDESTFPVVTGPDLSYNGGTSDAFVSKVSSSGAAPFVYSGYIGGSAEDAGFDIEVDNWQNAFITGSSTSTETTFPVAVGPDLTHNGGKDAFVSELRPSGSETVYCGYIGGASTDIGYGISVGSEGSVYIVGVTVSLQSSFPVTAGPDLSFNFGDDAFVAKVLVFLNPPTLVSPADLTTGQLLNATLSWTDTNSALQDQGYRIRIREQGGAYFEYTVAQDETSYATSGLALATTYEWNVQTMGNGQDILDSEWANEGTDWSFTTTDVLPSTTIDTSPTGLQITVDGSNYTAPHVFQWTPESSHTLGVSSPQSGATGTRYVFSYWSDAGNQSHTISAPYSSRTYTATFTTQYTLTTSASPTMGGTVTPSGATWQNAGSVQVQADPSLYWTFSGWSGDLSGTTNPTSIIMNAPKTVVANFLALTAYTLSVQATPSTGVPITVSPSDIDGYGNGNTNFTRRYYSGTSVSLTAPSTFDGVAFEKWTVDGVDNTNRTVQVTIANDETAVAVYRLAFQEVGSLVTPGTSRSVFISGSHAYVAAGSSGLRIIDISNAFSPSEVGFVLLGGSAEDVHVSGSLAFVAAGDQGLRIIDVSDPSSPEEQGFYDVPTSAYGVYVSGHFAYVADHNLGLRIVDISNPFAPAEAGGLSISDQATDVFVSGSYAYVTASGAGLRIINVTDPAAPFEAGFFNTRGTASRVHVSGTHAYVADQNGLSVIDISNPSAPGETGYWTAPDIARGVFAVGAYAYLADDDAGLRVIDISNLPSIEEIGRGLTPGPAYGVHIAGSYAFVAAENFGLRVFDLAGNVSPSIVVDSPGGMTIWIKSQSRKIEWTSTGSIGSVNIALYKGAAKVKNIALGTPDDGLATWTVPTTLTNGTDYSIRVWKSGDPSVSGSSDSFQINAAAVLFPPELLSPLTGATGQSTSLTLQWKDNNVNPQEKKYRVRVKQAGGAYVKFATLADATSYLLTNCNPDKTYFWNVMAVGNGTTTKNSAWANGGVDWYFSTAPPVTLNPPDLQSPAYGATGQPLNVTLGWLDTNSNPQEVRYQVRIKPAGGGYTTFGTVRDAVSYLIKNLAKNKTYYWNVRAKGTGTATKDSAWANSGTDWRFATGD